MTETFSFTRIEFSGRRGSGILHVLAGFVALLVAALFAFLVALFVALFQSLLVAPGVSLGITAIVGVARSHGRRRRGWHRIRIGRWIVIRIVSVARRVVINVGSRKIKGSRKEERIQNDSGSQSTNESSPYEAPGKTIDENDSSRKAGSNESGSTRKTASDENSSAGKTSSHDNGSAPRPGKRRARDSDQCDQDNYSDGFHSFSPPRKLGLGSCRDLLFYSSIHHIFSAKTRQVSLHDEVWFDQFARQANSKSAQTPT
jgi:hypothetical protein